MNKSRLLIGFMVLIAVASGCALPAKKPLKEIEEVPAEDPGERFGKEYLQRGRENEDKGDMVSAFKQYKLAVTVDPENQEATESRNQVEIKLRRSADKHYKAGLKFHKKGKYGRARHQFLIALRLWPDYPEVINILTSRKRIQTKRYLVHTIKPSESLSRVAKIYYGDYHKFPIIAKYNNITDATRIYVGQKIKVPEIEGMEFLVGKEDIRTEELEVADSGFWEWDQEAYALEEAPEPEVKEEEEEPVDRVAIYRDHGLDLFSKKEYQKAIVVFNKVLNVYPEDSVALEYSSKAHFQQGMNLFEKKDYLAARDQFEVCLRYRNDCQKCHGYIKRSENLYKEMHYNKGIQFFDKELLLEAIKEWELVKVIDPKYKRVDYLINKAKTILKKIKEIKESQKEQK